MGRVPRHRLGSGVFHVINRALNRQYILNEAVDRAVFLRFLVEESQKRTVSIHHWVIMSNHFHLALEAVKTEELSGYVGMVCRRYTMYHHKKYGGEGPLWSRRFKSTLVQKNGYMAQLGRYIERNPVRAEMAEVAWDYPWSSARAYINGEDDALVHIDDNWFYGTMGADIEARKKCYRQYLLDDRERADDELMFKESGPVIGDDDFKLSALRKAGRMTDRRRGPKPKAPSS